MTLHTLQILTVLLGVGSVLLSMILGWRFYQTRHSLGLAFGLMLLGEAFVSAITVWFSVSSLIDVYNTMGPYQAMAMRVAMFSVVSITTIHLYFKLRRLP